MHKQGADIVLFDFMSNRLRTLYRPGAGTQLSDHHKPLLVNQSRLFIVETETMAGTSTDHIAELALEGKSNGRRILSMEDGCTILTLGLSMGKHN